MNFPQIIKKLREEKGLTQKELAEKAGIAQATVSYYEQGVKKPLMENAMKLAKALNVPIEELME